MGFCQNPVEVSQKVDYFSLPEPDWVEVKKSDSLLPGNRVSVPILVDLNLQNSGKWSIDQSGYRRWNLTIEASNSALALAALLDTFSLSDGAVLSVFIENNFFSKLSLSSIYCGDGFITLFAKSSKAIPLNKPRLISPSVMVPANFSLLFNTKTI